MTFGQSISSGFSKYAQFGGTASRSEYWWWTLFSVLVSIGLGIVDGAFNGQSDFSLLSSLWSLAVLLPSLAVGVRRLRDAGYPWGYLFLALIPIVGAIILIVLLCQQSKTAPAVTEGFPAA
jgi:uncharacterized membrane protein YhaH (DUF805 family)